jgi:hypothetical protein
VILSWKKRASPENLAQDAAHRPEVDSTGVLLRQQHHLGSSVPPRDHVFREATCLLFSVVWHVTTSESKVTDLESAVASQKDVGRFQVTMRHARGVEVGHGPQKLAQNDLHVFCGERLLRLNDLVQIRRHVRQDKEDVFEVRT